MFYVGMNAYNEADIIGYSIQSFLHAVDRLIVIDGSAWGPSTDKTADIARSFGDKVTVISGTFKEKWEQNQMYLDFMEKDRDNWCTLVDADEVWDQKSLEAITTHCKNGNDQTLIYSYNFHHFYTPTKTIHGGLYGFPRIIGTFRLMPDIKFLAPIEYLVGLSDGIPLQNKGDPIWKIVNDVLPFHYGHYRPLRKILFKNRLYWDWGWWIGAYPHTEEAWAIVETYLRKTYSYPRMSLPIIVSTKIDENPLVLKEFAGRHPDVVMPYLEKMEKIDEEQNMINEIIPPTDPIKWETVRSYATEYKLKIFVETGTYQGNMVNAVKDLFDSVFSIELDRELFEMAKCRFASDLNVEIILGDSGVEIAKVLEKIRQPALFWLDAHYCGPNTAKAEKNPPICDELSCILNAPDFGHVILIDDVRCFGTNSEYPTVDEMKSYIISLRNDVNIIVENDIFRIISSKVKHV